MGTREEYTTCMKPYMTGGGPERKERFCQGAKICSGKAATKEEAARLCAEAAANPKPAANTGTRSRKCKIVAPDMAACVIEALGGSEISQANLTTAIAKCSGQKVAKPLTEKRFLRKCVKENQVTGKLNEMQGIINKCKIEWKAKEAPGEAG